MTGGGFAGKVLYVDLTHREIKQEPLDSVLCEKFIGGLGLTIKLAYDHIRPGTDALAPENPIVLGAGPLVGTNLPATSRVYTVTKLPTSGAIGWCGGGGVNFGCMLKNAGYDHVIIEGQASQPVFLQIIDDDIQILDARSLWGKGVEETCEALWQDFGRPAGVISIGQAGENKVLFSMAYIDRLSTLGRGGFGAVMGSKNLKAVMVKGSQGIEVAHREKYKTLSQDLFQTIREYPYLKEWQELGLFKSFPLASKDIYDKIKKRRIACVSCPVGDKDVVEIQDGEYKGLVKCSTSAANLFMPQIHGLKDYREAIKCVAVLDAYGLDMFEFFGIMGLVKELSHQGIIPRNQVEIEIDPGSLESMEAWARKISFREGLGDILADGFQGVLDRFGEEAERYAPPLVRGMLPYAGPGGTLTWNLFGTMELGQALDPRGPHVGASGSPTYFARRPLEVFPRHLTRMGVPREAIARILPGLGSPDQEPELKVGRLLRYSHRWFVILGSMGICARAQINRFYNASLCADLYEAVTGVKTDLDDLRKRVDRVWTLLRLANLREGFGRQDDALPEKWFGKSGFQDYITEKPLKQQDAEQMVEDYYDEWGWDPKTGIPTVQRLEELDLTGL
ncbi:MAG: hypothetical protein JRI95_10260 [Deltaproteobacteria bacterium]|nr:hypothetical protein [Deltaproteobacteria bacterium]MBW2085417.1 hypothetical protein [Deltaproteobacteria bacterium]